MGKNKRDLVLQKLKAEGLPIRKIERALESCAEFWQKVDKKGTSLLSLHIKDNNKKLVIEPKEAETVRQIFRE